MVQQRRWFAVLGDRTAIEIRLQLSPQFLGIFERIFFRVFFDEEVERIDHRHVCDQIDRNGQMIRGFVKDVPRDRITVGVLLQVDEVIRRADPHAVRVDRRAGVKGGAKPNALRSQRCRTIVKVFSFVMQSDADRHRLSIVKRALESSKRRSAGKNHQNQLAACSPTACKPNRPPRKDDTRRVVFCQSTTRKRRQAVEIAGAGNTKRSVVTDNRTACVDHADVRALGLLRPAGKKPPVIKLF